MNTISAQNPSMASVVANLASQTQAAADLSATNTTDQGQAPTSSGSDVLVISSSAPDAARTEAAQAIQQQARASALADSSFASAANSAASAMLSGNSSGPLAAQGNLDPGSVLSLLQEN